MYWSLFFNKVAGLQAGTLLKKTTDQVLPCKFSKILKNTYFRKHIRASASAFSKSIHPKQYKKNYIKNFIFYK